MHTTAMIRFAFFAFFASALGLLAATTSTHEHGAPDIQNVRCPQSGCYGFLTDSYKLPPIGYRKSYECSSGHMLYVK